MVILVKCRWLVVKYSLQQHLIDAFFYLVYYQLVYVCLKLIAKVDFGEIGDDFQMIYCLYSAGKMYKMKPLKMIAYYYDYSLHKRVERDN